MGNRYAGDGGAGPVEAFRDAGRDTYLEEDEEEIRAGWTFPNVTSNDEPEDLSSFYWRVPVYITVPAQGLGEAIELLTEKFEEAGIPFELE